MLLPPYSTNNTIELLKITTSTNLTTSINTTTNLTTSTKLSQSATNTSPLTIAPILIYITPIDLYYSIKLIIELFPKYITIIYININIAYIYLRDPKNIIYKAISLRVTCQNISSIVTINKANLGNIYIYSILGKGIVNLFNKQLKGSLEERVYYV